MRPHLKILAQHGEKYYVVATCNVCYQQEHFNLLINLWNRWQGGELIQRCFPQLTPDEREILISGICGDCFDKMFKEDAE